MVILCYSHPRIEALHCSPFVRKIYHWPVDSPHKGPVMQKVFPSQMPWCHHAIWHIHWLWKMVSLSLYIFIYHLCLYTIVKIKMIKTLQAVRVRTLTHWGWEKITAILQTTLLNAFSWMKMYEFRFKFHSTLFLDVQLTVFQHWFK